MEYLAQVNMALWQHYNEIIFPPFLKKSYF